MKSPNDFMARDARYGVSLPPHVVDAMLNAARAAGAVETGGILVGRYNDRHDTAVVTGAEGPPADSRATRTRFYRGVHGISSLLDRLWARPVQTYYLGEWHFHPFATPERSDLDDVTMQDPDLREAFRCPVPVLVILGGDPNGSWSLRAWAYPDGQPRVRLHPQTPSTKGGLQ